MVDRDNHQERKSDDATGSARPAHGVTRARLALPPVLQQAGVALDRPRHQVTRDGTFLALSKKEFAVLEIMMRAQSVVVSTEELLERRATSTPTRSPIPCA